jgi:hypothetical protein
MAVKDRAVPYPISPRITVPEWMPIATRRGVGRSCSNSIFSREIRIAMAPAAASASTAARAGSPSMPNSAITPSPMNLSICPLLPSTACPTASKYRFSTKTTS